MEYNSFSNKTRSQAEVGELVRKLILDANATQFLESGTHLRYTQELLGHKHNKTTEIYTHVSTKAIQNIQSPFDSL